MAMVAFCLSNLMMRPSGLILGSFLHLKWSWMLRLYGIYLLDSYD